MDAVQAIKHIAKFISGIWQIHPFCEGNTRTTAVFMIKYLQTFGFNVSNQVFAENSCYFRNALVRANFNDLQNNIHSILTGILLSSIDSAIIFYVLFVVIRSYTGGYHADTHLKCKLTLLFCCVTVVFFTNILEDKYNLIMHTIYVLLFISSVLIYAPIINGNKPMKKEEIERNRLKAIIISVVVCLLSYAVYFFSLRCTISIGITLVIISFLMVIGKLKERRKLFYEKK